MSKVRVVCYFATLRDTFPRTDKENWNVGGEKWCCILGGNPLASRLRVWCRPVLALPSPLQQDNLTTAGTTGTTPVSQCGQPERCSFFPAPETPFPVGGPEGPPLGLLLLGLLPVNLHEHRAGVAVLSLACVAVVIHISTDSLSLFLSRPT